MPPIVINCNSKDIKSVAYIKMYNEKSRHLTLRQSDPTITRR